LRSVRSTIRAGLPRRSFWSGICRLEREARPLGPSHSRGGMSESLEASTSGPVDRLDGLPPAGSRRLAARVVPVRGDGQALALPLACPSPNPAGPAGRLFPDTTYDRLRRQTARDRNVARSANCVRCESLVCVCRASRRLRLPVKSLTGRERRAYSRIRGRGRRAGTPPHRGPAHGSFPPRSSARRTSSGGAWLHPLVTISLRFTCLGPLPLI
jgi:hypothetical protein